MILEIAELNIQTGKQAEFDIAIRRGLELIISKSKGYISHQVHKGVESPERYVLMIFWKTLENHTVDFQQSPEFLKWREIVGPFFNAPPRVEHFTLLTESA
jgi:heme-degrading monooxygenase HmoA